MREILLITNREYGFNEFLKLLNDNIFDFEVKSNEGFILLEFKKTGEFFGDRVQIVEAFDADKFMEPDELDKINNVLHNPKFYFIEFKDIEKLKKILNIIANRDDVLIDNDFGLLTTGKNFLTICNEKPGWDWIND